MWPCALQWDVAARAGGPGETQGVPRLKLPLLKCSDPSLSVGGGGGGPILRGWHSPFSTWVPPSLLGG